MLIILIRLPPFTILNVNYVNTTVSGALSSQTTAQYAVAVRLISWPHTTGSFLPIITLTAHVWETVQPPQLQTQQKVGTHQSRLKLATNVQVDVPTATSTPQEMIHMLSVVMIIVVKALFVLIAWMGIVWLVANVLMLRTVSFMPTS
jgi:hypothetical protein